MFEWISSHETLLAWMGALGLLLIIASLVAIPLIVAYIPKDYFVQLERGPLCRGPFRQSCRVLKNLLGAVLILFGILMLVLPGQGILTMLIGLSLIEFPGKRQLLIRLVRVKRVRKSIAWIRHRAKQPDLTIPERGH